MIQKITMYLCPRCGSENLTKNGHNKGNSQQAHCKDCDAYFVLELKTPHGAETQKTLLKTALERCSLRGLERIFAVARQTAAKWIEAFIQALPPFRDSIKPAQPGDLLELDEAWSFVVYCKEQKRWLWTVMCRRTRQIIAYVIGDHSDETWNLDNSCVVRSMIYLVDK